ncbi:MAG: penicillin-binding protein 1B [Xanthomonadales bacterium]|nr:penicillin-binding protein 1B [Xanthomonadales bacterium]NNL94102.1 penicillin-binding protein 1B [Xanthomonadales bacterium]
MSTKKKKRTSRRRASSGTRKHKPFKTRLWRAFLLLLGFGLGLLAPWIAWLDHVVTSEFEGRKWDLPSRVYARPLSLYPGLELSAEALEAELEAAAYRRQASVSTPGSWTVSGSTYTLFRRSFEFEDGSQPALRVSVDMADGEVRGVRGPSGKLDLVRLDPAEIASIFPLHDEDRSLVSVESAPPLLITGLQAVEDRHFKNHPGVHWRGLLRAVAVNLKAGKTVQGGSTLTQQLVKNYYLSDERTLIRKLNEAFMALLLELHYDKAEILEAYLNEIYLGQQGRHGIHGFARASEFYFGQPLEALSEDRLALLVGMVRGASLYNPRRSPQRALERRNLVLDIFGSTGLLSAQQVSVAKARPLGVTARPTTGRSRYPAFIDLVRRQLRRDYREQDLRNEGLRIFTTLAPSDQKAAEAAVIEGMSALQSRGLPASLQSAVVLADVASGEVRALVGDRSPARAGFNRALDARRQVGSVIKPLVYLLALEHEQDYNLLTTVLDEPISLRQADGSTWSPDNYDDRSLGPIALIDALVQSRNQATVRVGMNIGVQSLISRLQQLGVEAPLPAVPSTLLGAVELTPLEVTQLYQSIAAGGYAVRLRAVTSVMHPDGDTLNRYPLRLVPEHRREAVALLNYALTQVVERGTARELPALLGSVKTIAGKTGTTNERRDSWFVGYTRDRVAVTWVGNDDNSPAGVTGGNAAMRLWAGLFRRLRLKSVDLDMPEGAYWTWVEMERNALSDPDCDGAVQMPFIDGTEPQQPSPCLQRLDRGNQRSIWRKWFD